MSKIPDGVNALSYFDCADVADLVAAQGQTAGLSQSQTIQRATDAHIRNVARMHDVLTAADCQDVRAFLGGSYDLPDEGAFQHLRLWVTQEEN